MSEFRTCVKVKVDVLGPVPNKPTVSVDVKQHFNHQQEAIIFKGNWTEAAILFKGESN